MQYQCLSLSCEKRIPPAFRRTFSSLSILKIAWVYKLVFQGPLNPVTSIAAISNKKALLVDYPIGNVPLVWGLFKRARFSSSESLLQFDRHRCRSTNILESYDGWLKTIKQINLDLSLGSMVNLNRHSFVSNTILLTNQRPLQDFCP